MELQKNHKFNSRKEIQDLFGGNHQKGITKSTAAHAILLFANEDELYTDGFYKSNGIEYLLYTGIGRTGNQDAITNKSYNLNMAVLTHKADKNALLVFSKNGSNYNFKGVFELIETHQNVQPDASHHLRRVFVFHLKKVSDNFILP